MDTFDFVRNKTIFSIKEKEKVSYRLEEGTCDPCLTRTLAGRLQNGPSSP